MTRQAVTDRVAHDLYVGVSLLRRRLRQAPLDEGLSVPQTAGLARLDRFGEMSPTQLARFEGISPQSAGAILNSLESLGYIQRRPDPGDGRRAVMSLTSAGKEALRQVRAVRAKEIADVLERHFTDDEIQALDSAAPLLEKLAHHLYAGL